MFIGDCVYTFEINCVDMIKVFTSNIGNNNIPYPIVYGENKYQLTLEIELMSYESIEHEDVRKRVYKQDGSFDCDEIFRFDNHCVKQKIDPKNSKST